MLILTLGTTARSISPNFVQLKCAWLSPGELSNEKRRIKDQQPCCWIAVWGQQGKGSSKASILPPIQRHHWRFLVVFYIERLSSGSSFHRRLILHCLTKCQAAVPNEASRWYPTLIWLGISIDFVCTLHDSILADLVTMWWLEIDLGLLLIWADTNWRAATDRRILTVDFPPTIGAMGPKFNSTNLALLNYTLCEFQPL